MEGDKIILFFSKLTAKDNGKKKEHTFGFRSSSYLKQK